MNDIQIQQMGSPPNFDIDLGTTSKQLTRKIRERVLRGEWPAQDRKEDQMIRDFKASGLTVKKFLDLKE